MIEKLQIYQWWDVFHSELGLPVEIRMPKRGKSGKENWSGYFLSVENLISELEKTDAYNVYSPFNFIDSSCSGRIQRDRIMPSDVTTSDNDIQGRRWILIDIDPVRSSGTNATTEEKSCAYKVMLAIGSFLRDEGFSQPVIVDSGNGYHLYYRVKLENSAENTAMLKTFLEVLDMFFSTSRASVDTSVFNASRIAKVPGTWSAKGANTEDRPYRLCKFFRVPATLEDTDIVYIRKVVELKPVEEKPSRFNGYRSDSFDIDKFLSEHGIAVAKEASFRGGRKIILEHCPFDSSHKAPDSAIFVTSAGAIGFKCLHNSCAHRTWKDVRLSYEPNAYEKQYREEYRQREEYFSQKEKPEPVIAKETDDKGKKWQQMSDIEWVDPTKLCYIPTGISNLDKMVGGLALGDVSILSGIAGSGKTSLINFVILNAIQKGYKVAVWSGELQPSRFQSWIDQTAAGRNRVQRSAMYGNMYYCPKMIAEKINAWLDGKLWLYNNAYGNRWSQLFSDIKECVSDNRTQLIVIDNLASMSLDSFAGEKNDRQGQFIANVKDFAKVANIHVIQVVHPRKEQMNSLLRMESISGSADLYNLADNVFLCHRVGKDFEKRAMEFFGNEDTQSLMGFNEVIEIAKNRSVGIKDEKIGLYFELESRRFKNTLDEYINYGWNEDPQMITLDMYDDVKTSAPKPQEQDEDDICPF